MLKYLNFSLGPKQIFILFGELAGLQNGLHPQHIFDAGDHLNDIKGIGKKIQCTRSQRTDLGFISTVCTNDHNGGISFLFDLLEFFNDLDIRGPMAERTERYPF